MKTKNINKEKTVSIKRYSYKLFMVKKLWKAFTFTQEGYDQVFINNSKNVTLDGENIGYLAISENANDIRSAINERKTFILRTAIFIGIVIFYIFFCFK